MTLAELMRWLQHEERRDRNALNKIFPGHPFDRGYYLGRAHTRSETVTKMQRARTTKATEARSKCR